MTQNVAGPYAGMILAEFGARVTKVESPQGDPTRSWGPPFWKGHSASYLALNRNKRLVTLDAKTSQGKSELLNLIKQSDVFLVSSRSTAIRSLGLTYERLSRSYPRLIYGEITAFGHKGPKAGEPGYDPLMQALSGIMSVTGRAGEEPVRVGVSIVDMSAGLWLALGTILALESREKNGRGHRVSVSLYETAIAWMNYHITGYWGDGKVPRGWGSGVAMISPYEAFQAKDGWIVIAAGNDKLFRKLSEVLGHKEWAFNRRFETNIKRVHNREELRRAIADITSTKPIAFWRRRLRAAGIPAAPVSDLHMVLTEPQLDATGIVQSIPHPDIDGFKSIGLPLLIDGVRPPIRLPPP